MGNPHPQFDAFAARVLAASPRARRAYYVARVRHAVRWKVGLLGRWLARR